MADKGLAAGEAPREAVSLLALDDDGRIRGCSLSTTDTCARTLAETWPCSDLFPGPA